MFVETIETLLGYVDQGGFVMPPLVVATFVLWYTVGYRLLSLRRGAVRSVRVLLRRYEAGKLTKPRGIIDGALVRAMQVASSGPPHLRRALDDALADFERDLSTGKVLIQSIVAAAPLAGLLGTVAGMIETFDSLESMALFTQSGGIAGGISQALLTTQMGLAVAVPGVVVGGLLDRRQQHLEVELAKIKDLVCAKQAEQGPGPEAVAA